MKLFINEFLPKYDNVDIEYIGGKDPEFVFFSAAGDEVERVAVAELDVEGIVGLLKERGFEQRSDTPNGTHDPDDEL